MLLTSDIYMKFAEKYPLLSREEEVQLFKAYANGDLSAKEKLFNSNIRFAVKIAYGFSGYVCSRMGFEDLVQQACMGLLEAIKKFNYRLGYRLSTYAVWYVKAWIKRFVIVNFRTLKFGGTQRERIMLFKFNEIIVPLEMAENEKEKEALYEKFSRTYGFKVKHIKEFEDRLNSLELSFDFNIINASRKGATTNASLTLGDTIGCYYDFDVNLRQDDSRKAVNEITSVLNERELDIIRRRFLNEAPETLQEIGNSCSISRERVRQLEEKALRKMKNHCRKKGIVLENVI